MSKSIDKQITQLSHQLKRYINRQSNFNLTGVFNNVTNKVDSKWDVSSKVENALADFLLKSLKEHRLLKDRKRHLNMVEKSIGVAATHEERQKAVRSFVLKGTLISSAQAGGAAIAGAPFTLIETINSLNDLWDKLEIVACMYGFEPYSPLGKVLILHILTLGFAETKDEKVQAYKAILETELLIETTTLSLKEQSHYFDSESLSKNASHIILKPLVTKKISQTIPLIGFGLGSLSNGTMFQNCLRIAHLIYARRYLVQIQKEKSGIMQK